MRRAGIDVVVAGLEPGPVTASRGTVLLPDTVLDQVLEQDFDLIVLPGGLPGADHLARDERLLGMLRRQVQNDRYAAAICAAPRALRAAGLLSGRRATAYPGALEGAADLQLVDEPVVVDGPVITSRGPGTAMDFALELIEALEGRQVRDQVEGPLVRP